MDYYVIGKLGSGVTSNVWHALDSKGSEVAIKMYAKATDDKNNPLTADDFNQQAKEAVGRDVEQLQTFYPFLKDKVHNVILNGFHCVVMPFFKPVPTSRRSSVLGDVAAVYRNQFMLPKNKERYIYNDGDLR
jgi:RIO-like serine/threonine protein kinase